MDYSINLYWENINRRVRFRIFHLYIFLFEHVSHCQTTKRSKMQICLTTRRFRQHNTFPIFRRVSTIGGGHARPRRNWRVCLFGSLRVPNCSCVLAYKSHILYNTIVAISMIYVFWLTSHLIFLF
jgi:hypothetical protein